MTDYVDGRVHAAERAAMQRHMRSCPACLQELCDIARLARATHNLPLHRSGPDLAERVRRGLADRRARGLAELGADAGPGPARAWHRAPALRAAAAALVLATVWGAGFLAGRGAEPASTNRDTVDPPVAGAAAPADAGSTPAAPAPQLAHERRPEGRVTPRYRPDPAPEAAPMEVVDPEFVTASREVLGDLAWAENLPQRARLPILASQFELFDLQARAERLLERTPAADPARPMARLVRDFGAALAAPREFDWNAWREQARAVDLRPGTGAARGSSATASARAADAPSLELVIDRATARCGADLSPAERHDLAALLRLKQQLVTDAATGPTDAAAATTTRFLSRWQLSTSRNEGGAGGASTSFRLAAGFRAMQTLTEAGQSEGAAELARAVEQMARELGLDARIRTGPDR